MKTGFIVAMEEEAVYLIDNLQLKMQESDYFKIFKKDDITLIISGVGLLAGAAATYYLAFTCECDELYSVGTCGATGSKYNHCEIVSIDKVYKRDFNLMPLGYKKYEVPNIGQYISTIPDEKYRLANCYSSDEFITSKSNVPNNVVVEMEAYSVAYIALIKKIPCHIYKIVTDFTKSNDNQTSYTNSVEIASRKLADEICKHFI